MSEIRQRCGWVDEQKPHYVVYHDEEWGVPVYDDQKLFEMLCLEGAQAGLNWETILKRRSAYRDAFYDFDPLKVAQMTDEDLAALMENKGIIRNRLKIWSVRKNARVFINIQNEFNTFSRYLWAFVGNQPIINHPETLKEVPAHTPLSDIISKDLKKRGMSFVGSTIIYAYMQAVGLVDDHVKDCFKRCVV
jgi:DNA-3-methyladenine glycosylase I